MRVLFALRVERTGVARLLCRADSSVATVTMAQSVSDESSAAVVARRVKLLFPIVVELLLQVV